ncbi:MAG: 3-deoxy-manno-octulosonate cytidylyltransferase [bacterium]|nr:3-deoxy-manno-octulosonate cytidylyltransferase [bacterium]
MSLVLGVIPARFASTRFPGKVLAPLGDKTMIEHVWLRASRAERIDRLVIATDDNRVLEAATAFGAEGLRTSRHHASGTDRCAEVARKLGEDYGVVVNIQGDEPLLTPTSLDQLVATFDRPSPAHMATLAEAIEDEDELFDPNVVKLVTGADGRALYFSRSPIPYYRGGEPELQADFRPALASRGNGLRGYRRHQGIYAYTREALLEFTRIDQSPLERDEGLEQLRALAAGYSIHVVDSDFRSQAVDTPADLERVAKILLEAH